ncbi:hypothetical protein FRC11_005476 [Ceratobasidium sp. 423]|nr:hypothetical protein FRC11_005476 [Ceratobasidium sp. 423]
MDPSYGCAQPTRDEAEIDRNDTRVPARIPPNPFATLRQLAARPQGRTGLGRVQEPPDSFGNAPSPSPPSDASVAGSSAGPVATTCSSKRSEKLQHATKAAGSMLKNSLKSISRSAATFPPLKSALDDLSEFVGILEDIAGDDEDLSELFTEFQSRTIALESHITKLVGVEGGNNCTSLIINSINEHMEYVKQRRQAGQIRGPEVMKRAQKIEVLLQRLHNDAELKTWASVAGMAGQLAEERLARLSPVSEASYNSSYARIIQRGSCTSGTRQDLLKTLQDWAQPKDIRPENAQLQPEVPQAIRHNTAKVFWMNGMAGTGKTTIAYSLCEWLEATSQLGASFFCSRTSSLCQSVDNIIPTIAYQLGRFSPAYKSTLCNVLHDDPEAATRDIQAQFDKLIARPMQVVKSAMPDGIVVVVDALDECEDGYGTQLILDLLLTHAPDLPIKFFITSRPEPTIREKMLSPNGPLPSVFYLHDIDASIVEDDIKMYLAEALKRASPSDDQIHQLARKSGKLFIYAATLVRYICPRGLHVPSKSRLQKIISLDMPSSQAGGGQIGNLYRELDQLYSTVLDLAFAELLEDQERTIMRDVLQTVVCAKEPIATETLAGLVECTKEDILYSLDSLHSVLHIAEGGGRISTLHASFPDFLLTETRAGPKYYCDNTRRNRILTQSCFEVMKQQLRFNICNLESSFVPDDRVPNLKNRIEDSISPTLFYACRFWGNHPQETHVPNSDELQNILRDFLTARLLFWMEVLNLSKCIGMGASTLLQIRTWMLRKNLWPNIRKEVSDAQKFLVQFGASGCSSCTPHIYISALPLCPRSSSVYENYRKCTRGLTSDVLGLAPAEKAQTELVSFNGESMIHSVVFSPDGTRIVSGASNGVIQTWDVYNGTTISKPLLGHSRSILSVAISPDGAFVISGSSDRTVRVWEASTGNAHGKVLEGHTNSVNSVVFSQTKPILIASGSSDKTIRLWDMQSCNQLGFPLEGHSGPVNSIAFSPTSTRLVSGSVDKSIRIWDSLSGTLLLPPIIGHLGSVNSVAFSPDGARIVSGSHDQTIRIWDADTGLPLGQPFNGHTGWVKSVAFVSDCTRIVSGSFDRTIRVWDVQTGKELGQPFEGHTGWVSSVAFSPEGSYIISSSSDKTIRLWDAYPDAGHNPHFEEHTPSNRDNEHSQAFDSSWDIQRNQKFDKKPLNQSYELLDLNPLVRRKDATSQGMGTFMDADLEFKAQSKVSGDSYHVSMNQSDTHERIGANIDVKRRDSFYARIELGQSPHSQEIVSVAFSRYYIRIVLGPDGAGRTARVWEVDLSKADPSVPQMSSFLEHLACLSTRPQLPSLLNHSPSPPPPIKKVLGPVTLTSSGWLTGVDDEMLFWLPHALRHDLLLLRPPHLLLAASDIAFGRDPSKWKLAIGEEWTKCYVG